MSDSKNNEKETFSIDTGDWNNEVPSVTGLIRLQDNLQLFGVILEHHFKMSEGKYTYLSTTGHQGKLLPWQKNILQKMTFDEKTFKVRNPFQEFPETQSVLNEIFASDKPSFIQIINSPTHHENLIVLQSKNSLIDKRERVLNLFAKNKENKLAA